MIQIFPGKGVSGHAGRSHILENPEEVPELPQETFPRLPMCWSANLKAEQDKALKELRTWSERLVRRYALGHRTVPPCWAEHGALVEELSALHTAWAKAFAAASTADEPLRWHGDYAAARRRRADWAAWSGRRVGEHRPEPTPRGRSPCQAPSARAFFRP